MVHAGCVYLPLYVELVGNGGGVEKGVEKSVDLTIHREMDDLSKALEGTWGI